jgi:hypothetical protein
VETLATQLDFGWSPLLGIRTLEHKYVRAPRPELYALASDPGETRNLASEQPELASRLDAQVQARGAARKAEPNLAVDPEVTERLRALGYVAADKPPASGRPLGEVGGPDPKDELDTLRAIQEAFQLLVTGREVEALERLMDECQKDLEPLQSFILPGGGTVSAFLHQARTVCRRAERQILRLTREEDVGEQVVPYVNRLSDLLFVLSRWIGKQRGEREYLWERGLRNQARPAAARRKARQRG